MKKENLTKTLLLAAVIILSVFAFWGCEKEPFEIEQEFEMVTARFGIFDAFAIEDKSWSNDTWVLNYNNTPTTLSLIGVGNNTGNNYSIETTIQDLQAGTVTMTVLKGAYDISFETGHITSSNPWYMWNVKYNLIQNISEYAQLSEKVDIKIDMKNVDVQTNPITLNATIQDLLIIFDVPNISSVLIGINGSNAPNRLIIDETNNFHWGYFAMNPYEKGEHSNTGLRMLYGSPEKIIDAHLWQVGNIYHIKSGIEGEFSININPMNKINITAPL